jgi:hypothetical protein
MIKLMAHGFSSHAGALDGETSRRLSEVQSCCSTLSEPERTLEFNRRSGCQTLPTAMM